MAHFMILVKCEKSECEGNFEFLSNGISSIFSKILFHFIMLSRLFRAM